MADEQQSEVQRWTAKRRAALVISVLRGETTAAEAARRHGLKVAEVEEWRERFLLGAENALRARPKERPYWLSRLARYPTHPPRGRLCRKSSKARCPQGPQALGSNAASRLWTCGQRAAALREFGTCRTWWPPRGFGFEHGVENRQQLARHRDQSHLGRFPGNAQAQIEEL